MFMYELKKCFVFKVIPFMPRRFLQMLHLYRLLYIKSYLIAYVSLFFDGLFLWTAR